MVIFGDMIIKNKKVKSIKKFIYIQDETAKQELLKLGFRLVQENKDLYIFENSKTLKFDNKKVDFKYALGDTLFF